MSWGITGALAATALTSLYQHDQNKRAIKRAERDEERAAKAASLAELFAKSEGEGQGMVADVELGVDQTLDEEERDARSGRALLRI